MRVKTHLTRAGGIVLHLILAEVAVMASTGCATSEQLNDSASTGITGIDGAGGSATGGAPASTATTASTGGAASSTGGTSASGGASGGTGATASSGGTGGTSTGGGTSIGGSTAIGGGTSIGGSTATGGGTSAGGSTSAGGAASAGATGSGGTTPIAAPSAPAVARGASYRGFPEQFNRYYTDAAWQPSRTIYVSPAGGGDGSTKASPTTVTAGLSAATPGTRVFFVTGTYDGCFELASDQSGTYDAPIVLYGERTGSGTRGAVINCCSSGRQTCINLEAADYVAVDGFELVGGGGYGVRAVGADYAATQHQKGVAVLDCEAHGQARDPFFTGSSDWYVIERSLGRDAGSTDGHGIYLSNGSDWNIVRFNELRNNHSSDFQINADPPSTCTDIGIDVSSPDCDALAGTPGDGGRGASDFMLVEGNFFHDGLAQGANFTSARHSIVRNNLFANYAKQGVSFWQETTNPNLGSSDNQILHNLFVADVASRPMLQFVVSSDRNHVENNVFVGVGSGMVAMEVDSTVGANQYVHDWYINASLDGRSVGANEWVSPSLDQSWFAAFPAGAGNDPAAWKPSATAPFLNQGALLSDAALDRDGTARTAPTDLGPYER